jgi:hypothetical protein
MDTLIAPVLMIRGKETRHKPCKMQSSRPGGSSGSKKRKKTPNKVKPTQQRVMHIDSDMKTKWFWRAI